MNGYRPLPSWLPTLGCLTILAVLSLVLLMPFLLVDLMQSALIRLHLSSSTALLAVIGIFLGSLVNIPVYRVDQDDLQPMPRMSPFGQWAWTPPVEQFRDTLIAVNLGGCVIPTALAAWQLFYVVRAGGWPLMAIAIVIGLNVAACARVARPVPGIGIMMPGFVSALVAVGSTWLLLMPAQYMEIRASVAFVGGVAGPLIGADLLHLRDITRVPIGMLSIGGAGTFDGIVLSGFLAALLV